MKPLLTMENLVEIIISFHKENMALRMKMSELENTVKNYESKIQHLTTIVPSKEEDPSKVQE